MIVWLVMKDADEAFEVQGVFSSEEKALDCCAGHDDYGLGPLEMDTKVPDESLPWPGYYFPSEAGRA